MATGGHQNPGKDMCPNESNHGNGHGDRPTAWTLLPNNLELNSRSKPTKKQRNKDKSRTTISSQNLSSFDTNASTANKVFDSILHTLSDTDASTTSKRNVKLPVNHRQSTLNSRIDQPSSSRAAMENGNRTSKEEYLKKHSDAIQTRYSNLKDCQAQVESVIQQFEGSSDPRITEQMEIMRAIQSDLTEKKTLLGNFAKQVFDESEEIGIQVNAFADVMGAHEINGVSSTFRTEEEVSNIQNHLLEKVKASHEKMLSLTEHTSLLTAMQKKAQDKIASFQAQAAEHAAIDPSLNDQEWCVSPRLNHNSGASNKVSVNGECNREKENFSHSPSPWHSHSLSKPSQNNQQNVLENETPQDLSRLHVNLDHIKRRLELLQQLSNQNSTDPEQESNGIDLSSMQDEMDDNMLLDQRAAIEWERKRLKNTLSELQEKKKINENLKKQLLQLKEASIVADYNDEDSTLPTTNISEVQQPYSEENIRTLEDLRETIGQLRRMLNNQSVSTASNDESNINPVNVENSGSQQDTPSKLHAQLSTCAKHDNIRKEQRNQFPARRHYEAEGRANEDSDIPLVPFAAVAASSSPDPNAWENDIRIQEKKRQLENTKQKLQMMQNLVNSIQEARASGQQVPLEFFQVLSSFNEEDEDDEAEEDEDDEEEDIDFDDNNTVTDNEESQENCDAMSGKNKPSEVTTTRVKECSNDTPASASRFSDNERSEIVECVIAEEIQNLEHLKSERERLAKLQEKFLELQHKFSSPKQNNESTRCSGEGGNLQDKRSRQALQVRRSRQQNLLTRQNVATVESQNRNNSTNLPKTATIPLKKDNINDLSAKLTKPSGHNGVRVSSDTLNKYNSDAASFSTDPNQSLPLRDEVQHKSVLEHILKHGKNKTQNFIRRENHVHSNSSINSEPLDGSSRSFAPDTTVAATWGGSSTQENFEDENEPESVEDQDEEEEEEESNNEVAGNISELERSLDCDSNRCRIGEPFSHFSADSSSKRRDNRLQKYFKSTQLNQWSSRKNFSRPEASCNRNQNLPVPPSDYPTEEPQECLHASGGYVHALFPKKPDVKFRKELQYHISKLNALCEPVLNNPQPLPTDPPPTVPASQPSNSETQGQGSFSYQPPNTGRPLQTSSDIMQHYTQQLQLQQQLLLSLSQCYHALYVQQLEIQHLGRCLHQNPELDTGVQPLPNVPTAPSEDMVYRPWFFAPWLNPAIPQMPFAPGQVSPMSAPPFLQPSQASFTFNPTVGNSNSSQCAPCALVTGIQPARAVVHPDRQNPETLNNQVPPRTRANNFWDNFRSQSRQNLLSSSNTARAKDSSGHFSAPQVRQVHPVVPNESSWSHRSRVFIPPHQENNSSTTHATERPFSRPATDSSFRIACRAKKPNWSRQSINSAGPDSTMGITNRYNLCPETDQPNLPSSANQDVEHHTSEQLSTLGSRIETRFSHTKAKPSATATNSVTDMAFDSVQSEIAKILSQNDNQSGYLMELLRELRNLKSDSLQRALSAVRELVSTEGAANAEPFVAETFENSNQPTQIATRERADSSVENNQDGNLTAFLPSFSEPIKGSSENPCQRSNHNWPPATIIPLGKHTPKPSTGAVKKRPVSESVPPTACAWIQASAAVPENEVNPQRSASLESLVAKVIQNSLPFIHSHATEECCPAFRANFCSKIIDALKNGSSFKISPEFLLQLHPILLQLLNRYSNLKLMDCQGDLIKHLGSTLYRELELCKSISYRPSVDEGCDSTSTIPKKSAQPDLLPSSSKSFCDLSKQVLPAKEEREPIDSGVFFSSSGMQEYENHIGELFINMPAEENILPAHLNGSLVPDGMRGVLSGGCSPPTNTWPSQAINAEEDMAYECEAEAEAEPEVEAGTEADLAEADQSPGQQGATSNDAWHAVSQAACSARSIPPSNSEEIILAENGCFVDSTGVLGLPLAQAQIVESAEKEICLDDIPTKLSPLSEEDLQKQMSDEQGANSLLLEVVEPVSLARNGDCSKDTPPPAPYL